MADATAIAETKKDGNNEDDTASDVELEGMDLDGIDEEENNDEVMTNNNDDASKATATTTTPPPTADAKSDDGEEITALQAGDAEELEAAKRERMELLEAERKAAAQAADTTMTPKERFEYLLSQSDVFAHFLAGSVAAAAKKNKKSGSRGKSGRMTEEEEDAQLLKSAQSKRRTVRLDTQPGILAPTCTMHKYQLEGLNWLIKLHDSGINGILADEVSSVLTGCVCFVLN